MGPAPCSSSHLANRPRAPVGLHSGVAPPACPAPQELVREAQQSVLECDRWPVPCGGGARRPGGEGTVPGLTTPCRGQEQEGKGKVQGQSDNLTARRHCCLTSSEENHSCFMWIWFSQEFT